MKRFGWLFLFTLCAAPAFALPGATTTFLVCDDTLMAACALGAAAKQAVPGVASTAESSAVINIARFSRIGLRIRAIPAGGDTSTVMSFAIAFKVPAPDSTTGGAADSLAGFWQPPVDAAGYVASMDSVFDNVSLNPAAGGGGPCGFWPGEMAVSFDPWMGRGAMKSDQFYGPTTKWIPLGNTVSGGGLLPPRIQVRIRQLRGHTVASAKKVRVQAWLDCTE